MPRKSILLIGVLPLLLLAAEAARVLWYLDSDPAWKSEPVLTCWFPSEVERGDMKGAAVRMLSYDSAEVLRFSGPDPHPWQMESIRLLFEPGNKHYLNDIFAHSPEICMRGSGAQLERVLEARQIEIDGQLYFVRHLVFRHAITKERVNVFKFVWIGGMKEAELRGTETNFSEVRIKAARARLGHPPALLILANVMGAKSDDQAWEIFRDQVMARARFE